jgi:hypothetical protein
VKEHDFVLDNEFVVGDESELFFSGDPVQLIRPDADLPQVLYLAGIFPSRSQAVKNCKPFMEKLGLDSRHLPGGFMQFRAGKRSELITVLKPIKANLQ